MDIPADFHLEAEAFEDVLELETATRRAVDASDPAALPRILEIHDSWKLLSSKLPETFGNGLSAIVHAMLEAFNRRDSEAVRAAQVRIAHALHDLRAATA